MKNYYITDNSGADFKIKEIEVKKGILFQLYTGENGWIHPNSLIVSMLDSENGIKIKFKDKVKLKDLKYHEAEYLRLLLNFNQSKCTIRLEYTINSEADKI